LYLNRAQHRISAAKIAGNRARDAQQTAPTEVRQEQQILAFVRKQGARLARGQRASEQTLACIGLDIALNPQGRHKGIGRS
jgi:hypothetical protein